MRSNFNKKFIVGAVAAACAAFGPAPRDRRVCYVIMDNELTFADGTWGPTAIATNVSTNVVDMGPLGGPVGPGTANAGRNLGVGEEMWFEILCQQTATSGGAATVDFRLRTDSAANMTTSPVDLVSTGALGFATLVNKTYPMRLMLPWNATYKRYLGVVAVIATAVLTAGLFSARILKNPQMTQNYAAGFLLDI